MLGPDDGGSVDQHRHMPVVPKDRGGPHRASWTLDELVDHFGPDAAGGNQEDVPHRHDRPEPLSQAMMWKRVDFTGDEARVVGPGLAHEGLEARDARQEMSLAR